MLWACGSGDASDDSSGGSGGNAASGGSAGSAAGGSAAGGGGSGGTAGGSNGGASGSASGGATCSPEPENSASACRDGCDNDNDSYIDCDDKDCCSVVSSCPASSYCGRQEPTGESTAAACANGVDDDSNGQIDCEDVRCCGVRDCPKDTGCNPAFCLDGIAEITGGTPDMPKTTRAGTTRTSTAVGPFQLQVAGISVSWNPKLTAPYNVDCTAVDQFIRNPHCRVKVDEQRWKTESTCGTMQGTISLVYVDGSGAEYSIVFASGVEVTEDQVTFAP